MTIHRATRDHETQIQHVIRTCYDLLGWPWDPGDYHADLYDIEAHYDRHGHEFYVAETNGQVVGTAALEVFPAIPETPYQGKVRIVAADCSIERLYVLPDSRGQGIGTALLKHVLARAQERGATVMEIWSDTALHEAHRIYEKFGAERVANRICDDPNESPEFGMRLRLT